MVMLTRTDILNHIKDCEKCEASITFHQRFRISNKELQKLIEEIHS